MPQNRVNILVVLGEEESTKDLIKFAGIVGLGFDADVTFLAVNPASRQEYQMHTSMAVTLLSEWEFETIATKKLTEAEEWLVKYNMVLSDEQGKALSITPFHRLRDGILEKELKGKNGQKFILKLREGDLGEEVVIETHEKNYEMIFIGAPKSWKHIYTVIQFADPPVMVVRKWTSEEYEFLVCLDGSPPSWRALKLGTRLAKVLVTPLEVMTVADKEISEQDAEEILSKAERFLKKSSMPHKLTLEKGKFRDIVLAKSTPHTILTIGTSRRSNVWQLIAGATPFKLASQSKGPVLVVK